MASFQTLTTTRYFPPGVYIGQLIQPAPGNPNVTRIPCYVGRGSRFAFARDLQIRRAYVYAEPLTFPTIPPFIAPLAHIASNQKANGRLFRDDGIVVKTSQWDFVLDTLTGTYNTLIISPEAYDGSHTYKMDYQSLDRAVLDRLPVEDVRAISALGMSPNSPDFTEYVDYFLNYTVSAPLPATANNNKTSSLGAISQVAGVGVGTVAHNVASSFTHNYNRFYQIRCVEAGIDGLGNRYAAFAWQANPMSGGNVNDASTPLKAPNSTIPTAALLLPNSTSPWTASTPSIDLVYPRFVVSAATAVTTVSLEHGLVLDFTFSTGFSAAAPGDLFTFNAFGPALFEVDPRLNSNINQVYQSGPVAEALTNNTNVGVTFADANNPTNTYNANYALKCIAAPAGAHAAITHTNGGATVKFTNKASGLIGNDTVPSPRRVVFVASAALAVAYSGGILTVNYVTGVSTFTAVISAINGLTSSDISASLTAGVGTTVIVPVGPYLLAGGVDNTGTFMWNEFGANINVSGTFTYTQTTTAVTNPAPVPQLSNGVIVQLDCIFDNFKADAIASFISNPGIDQLVWSARSPGPAGNNYTVAVVSGVGLVTLVALVGNAITVTMKAGGSSITEILNAVNLSGLPVYVTSPSGTPATLVVAFSSSALTGGLDADSFTFPVLAPRQFYQAKDSRDITLDVSTATNVSVGVGNVGGSYVSNTLEGGFSTFTATANSLAPSAAGYANGMFMLPSNVTMFARNLFGGPTTSALGNRHVVLNKHLFSVEMGSLNPQGVRFGTIDWTLTSYTTEEIDSDSILIDVSGIITGVPSTRYAILTKVPDTISYVRYKSTGAALSYTLILTATTGENTQYIAFPTPPTGTIQVRYQFRALEPNAGEFYFLTGRYIRPDEFYNTPLLITSLDEGRKLLDPPEITNHLSIMNEIVMGDISASAMYVVQVKDPDGDGTYTDVDFKNAIKASEQTEDITDLVVLSHFSSLSDQLASVTSMSDPFKQRFRMAWVGAPIGTPIGSENQPNSLVYLAQRTLQVTGTSPAHGTRVLVSPTVATREILIDNGTTIEVSLDGSFIAGALAGLVASFVDPGFDILRKQLPGFRTIQTYGERASPENLQLGGSNIVYFTNQGSGVYIMEENVTVDNFAPDFNLINNMTQKMAVTRYVTDEMDSKLIGIVVPSAQAGVGLVSGFLVRALSLLVSRGIIGRYQTADGRERPIDVSLDVQVQRDSVDPTRYHVLYSYFLRNTIKRITGLYAVNTNNFGVGT